MYRSEHFDSHGELRSTKGNWVACVFLLYPWMILGVDICTRGDGIPLTAKLFPEMRDFIPALVSGGPVVLMFFVYPFRGLHRKLMAITYGVLFAAAAFATVHPLLQLYETQGMDENLMWFCFTLLHLAALLQLSPDRRNRDTFIHGGEVILKRGSGNQR